MTGVYCEKMYMICKDTAIWLYSYMFVCSYRHSEVPQVLFRLSRWENLEHAKEI